MPPSRSAWGGRNRTETHEDIEARRVARVRKANTTLRHRLQAFAWWRAVMMLYPGGVVPVPTAARMMGVSPQRVRELIAETRLPAVDGMPGGGQNDYFVPVDALLGAPTMLETGRAEAWCLGRDYVDSTGRHVNQWAKTLGLSTIRVPQKHFLRNLQQNEKILPGGPSDESKPL